MRTNEPPTVHGPRFYLAGAVNGNVVYVHRDVNERTARHLERLAADEPPFTDPERAPVHLDEYNALLSAETPVTQQEAGLIWQFPEPLTYPHTISLVRSETLEGAALLAGLEVQGMPEPLVALGFIDISEFWSPWCAALEGDAVASIAFATRVGSRCAEIGVATVPAFRGRGLAAAAAAGWASHPELRGRLLFYSTSTTNRSSRMSPSVSASATSAPATP